MKIIQFDEDRYVIDIGENATRERVEEAQRYWENWMDTHTGRPSALFIGGSTVPLEYEDRRVPDLEKRLAELEAVLIHHNHG